MEKLELPIEDLILDLENPRLGAVSNQSEALKGLVGLGITYFKNMMQSIKNNGLDPGDSFYILEDESDPDTFIVVDGNRRLAALKVLIEPATLQSAGVSEGQVKQLANIASGFKRDAIEAVSCVRFDTREAADLDRTQTRARSGGRRPAELGHIGD